MVKITVAKYGQILYNTDCMESFIDSVAVSKKLCKIKD